MLGRELRWDRVGWDGIGWGLGGKAYFIFNVSLFFFLVCSASSREGANLPNLGLREAALRDARIGSLWGAERPLTQVGRIPAVRGLVHSVFLGTATGDRRLCASVLPSRSLVFIRIFVFRRSLPSSLRSSLPFSLPPLLLSSSPPPPFLPPVYP